jgi:HTH-type transcriptional regulator / antitoxin HigA
MTKINRIHSDLAIPPGEYLEEVIDDLGMSKDDLAKRMNRPSSKLSAIFKGDKAITPETALQLEKVVGVAAHIWLGLESEYRIVLARQQESRRESALKEECELVPRFGYSELVKYGQVEKKTKPVEKVRELQKFFGVTSLNNIRNIRLYSAAFRREISHGKTSPEALAAWLRIGERKALDIDTPQFNASRLKASLTKIRRLNLLEPDAFLPRLDKLLHETGTAFILFPSLKNTGVYGSTFWLGKQKKAVVMMSLRRKWSDIFWFSLFHEIGHILLHGQNMVFLENMDYASSELQKQEAEADEFASNILIPKNDYRLFVEDKDFSRENIICFAGEIGVAPGIVVGRLQHDNLISHKWHNDLRSRYTWNE